MKIGIIGGSIAGCAVGALLLRLGFEVTIFERASQKLEEQGVGIILPATFFRQCKKLNLFETNMPYFPARTRAFFSKESASVNECRQIWMQIIDGVSLNWQDVYASLRRRIPKENYFQEEVLDLVEEKNQCRIETASKKSFVFDFVIGADGVASKVRAIKFPKSVQSKYAEYVAWRGTLKIPASQSEALFKVNVPYYVFEGGHLLLYRLPAPPVMQFLNQDQQVWNWVLYENDPTRYHYVKSQFFSEGKNEISVEQRQHFHRLIKKKLPEEVSAMLATTKSLFMQIISDVLIPQQTAKRVVLIGDAAAVLRPHAASGVLKALRDAITLAGVFAQPKEKFESALSDWREFADFFAKEQAELAIAMGELLVKYPVDWQKMDADTMMSVWDEMMAGKTWHLEEPLMGEEKRLLLKAKL